MPPDLFKSCGGEGELGGGRGGVPLRKEKKCVVAREEGKRPVADLGGKL